MRRALPIALAVVAFAVVAQARAGVGSGLTVAAKAGTSASLSLVARFQGSAAGDHVAFFVVSREFGQPRQVPIGVAAVGKDGAARVAYAPTWNGEQQFVARLGGQAATARFRVTRSAAGPLYAGSNPGRPLASVGHVFLRVILTLVALVWLSLFITLALAFGRLPRLAGRTD